MQLRSGKIIDHKNDKMEHKYSFEYYKIRDSDVTKVRDINKYICKKCSLNAKKKFDEHTSDYFKKKGEPDLYTKYDFRYKEGRFKDITIRNLKYLLHMMDNYVFNDEYIMCEACEKKCRINNDNPHEINKLKLKSCIIHNLFELMTSKQYIKYTKDLIKNHNKFRLTVKNKMFSFKHRKQDSPIDYYWKGIDYHYKKLFGISSVLDYIIPIDIYKKRENVYLNDSICGHPMASHGWMYEAMKNIEELCDTIII